MIKPEIHCKNVGYSNATLILNGENSVLVDTGVKSQLKTFKVWFKQHNLKPSNIKLIILTHTHNDHTGNLEKLKKYTGAKVLVHINEFEHLKKGDTPIPIGLGNYSKFISKLGRKLMPNFASPKPFLADLVNESEFSLNDFGIEGKVISTPGHSSGSQAVLIGENLISGDVFVNMRNGQIFPSFANDPVTLLETWEDIFDRGVKVIYPGHGRKFNIGKAFPEFEKWSKKLR